MIAVEIVWAAARRARTATPVRLAVAVIAGLAAIPTSASAWPADDEPGPRHVRSHRQARPDASFAAPPAAIVNGYLPRNNNVPMYNEPPRIRSSGRPAW